MDFCYSALSTLIVAITVAITEVITKAIAITTTDAITAPSRATFCEVEMHWK